MVDGGGLGCGWGPERCGHRSSPGLSSLLHTAGQASGEQTQPLPQGCWGCGPVGGLRTVAREPTREFVEEMMPSRP